MAEVDSALSERFPGLAPDVLGELASISRLHSLDPQELFYKWESYNIKMGGDNSSLDLKTVRDFKKDVQDALERDTRSKMSTRPVDRKPVGATPRTSKGGAAGSLFDGMDGVITTPRMPMSSVNDNSQKRRAEFATPRSKSTKINGGSSPTTGAKGPITPFSSRQNAGQTEMSINTHIEIPQPPSAPASEPRIKLQPNISMPKFAYKNMAMKLSEASEVLDDRIESFWEIIRKHNNLDDSLFGNPTLQSTNEIVAVGRIACDSPDGILSPSTIVLETSRQVGAGVRVPLKLDKVAAYNFFPGKIVALRGRNASGEYFAVSEVLEIPLQYSSVKPLSEIDATAARLGDQGRPLNIIIAAGPYTADANLDFEPLHAICERAAETMADGLILLGPFLDSEHPLVASGDLASVIESLEINPDTATLDDVFRALIAEPLNHLTKIVPNIKIMMIPAVRDVINKHANFPQDRFDRKRKNHFGLPQQCSFVTNPITIFINEIIFTISSHDIFYELKRQECSKQKSGQTEDSFARMTRQLLEQRHVFPIFPLMPRAKLPKPTPFATDSTSADNFEDEQQATGASIDVSYLGLGEIPNVRPDVLITPSSLMPFVKVVDSVTVINPGSLSKRREPGTFAQMYIQPRQITDEERTRGRDVAVKLFDRARVDVVKI